MVTTNHWLLMACSTSFWLRPWLLPLAIWPAIPSNVRVIDVDQLLAKLTEPQRQAVTHVDGPLLIVAAAGSGKTRVITHRVSYLISQGIPPSAIVAITFTNKAAGEMKSRVSQLLEQRICDFGRLGDRWPTICTFHSLCLRILRHYGQTIGLPPNFAIFDSADQTRLVKEALKLADISSEVLTAATVHSRISQAKNMLIDAQDYMAQARFDHERKIGNVYARYQMLLKLNNGLDFDDLLMRTAQTFRDHPAILKELQERFRYILIDEYQDTNHAQYVVAHALALRYRNICVVGDPDQSIYAWRGADIQNILRFEKDYADAKVIRLEQNYRSTPTILRLASKLIERNRLRKEKSLWTKNSDGPKARLLLCQDDRHEADAVAETLRELHDSHKIEWSGMAIFYRVNALSRVMEDALRTRNIPYVMARGVEFYNRREIKDVLAYLRVIANPQDQISLARIVNVPPRGIGDAAIKLLLAHAGERSLGLWQAMEQAANVPGLSARAGKSLAAFVQMVNHWRGMAGRMEAVAAAPATPDGSVPERWGVQHLMEDVLRRSTLETAYKKERGPDTGEGELENVNALITSAAEYDAGNPQSSLSEYLNLISLVSDTDHLTDHGGAVTLMTLHAAKGLEFPVVAIIGLEEGVLPHARAAEDAMQMEEERRLCFVGITRAQRQIIFSKAAYRVIRGQGQRTVSSPFLRELPAEDLEILELRDAPYSSASRAGTLRSPSSAGRFSTGSRVRHPMFGVGVVVDVSEMGSGTRIVVQFNTFGRKTLILESARLEPA